MNALYAYYVYRVYRCKVCQFFLCAFSSSADETTSVSYKHKYYLSLPSVEAKKRRNEKNFTNFLSELKAFNFSPFSEYRVNINKKQCGTLSQFYTLLSKCYPTFGIIEKQKCFQASQSQRERKRAIQLFSTLSGGL